MLSFYISHWRVVCDFIINRFYKMKKILVLLVFLAFSLLGRELELKELIHQLESKPRSEIESLDLVKFYYQDQQHQKAFDFFLDILNQVPHPQEPKKPSDKELALYQEALKFYLDPNLTASQAARVILNHYSAILKENPEYYSLGFLVATSYANLSLFDQFFNQFYQSYRHDPTHYLAHKTIASLYLRLYEREPPGPNKEKYRSKILDQLEQALELNQEDVNLYKLVWLYTTEDRKGIKILECLNKIIDRHIVIPRGEIRYFVLQALNHNQIELSQRFLDEMKNYHQYSRAIIQAQKLIDEKQKR